MGGGWWCVSFKSDLSRSRGPFDALSPVRTRFFPAACQDRDIHVTYPTEGSPIFQPEAPTTPRVPVRHRPPPTTPPHEIRRITRERVRGLALHGVGTCAEKDWPGARRRAVHGVRRTVTVDGYSSAHLTLLPVSIPPASTAREVTCLQDSTHASERPPAQLQRPAAPPPPPLLPRHPSSYPDLIPEEELEAFARMEELPDTKPKSMSTPEVDLKPAPSDLRGEHADGVSSMDDGANDYLSVNAYSYSGLDTPSTHGLSRSASSADVTSTFDAFGEDSFPPVDRLTMFDILENFALPQRLEKMQNAIHDNAEKLRRQRARLASRALSSKNNLVGEWRKRVPAPEEQLDKYRRRMRDSVDRLNKRWNDAKTVTMKEKISFVTAVLNIFISAYMIGGWPQFFHYWYTAQLAYVSAPPIHSSVCLADECER